MACSLWLCKRGGSSVFLPARPFNCLFWSVWHSAVFIALKIPSIRRNFCGSVTSIRLRPEQRVHASMRMKGKMYVITHDPIRFDLATDCSLVARVA